MLEKNNKKTLSNIRRENFDMYYKSSSTLSILRKKKTQQNPVHIPEVSVSCNLYRKRKA